MTTITDAMLVALEGHENAEAILAVLAESEPEPAGAEHEEFGQGTLPQLVNALQFHVGFTARWRTERETLWQGERPATLSTSDRTAEGPRFGFDALAFAEAHEKRERAIDRAAFPFLFDAKGRKRDFEGRQAKANMAKARAAIAG